jgi:hypothetical protein
MSNANFNVWAASAEIYVHPTTLSIGPYLSCPLGRPPPQFNIRISHFHTNLKTCGVYTFAH